MDPLSSGALIVFLWHWCAENGVEDDCLEIHLLSYLLKLQSHLGTIRQKESHELFRQETIDNALEEKS